MKHFEPDPIYFHQLLDWASAIETEYANCDTPRLFCKADATCTYFFAAFMNWRKNPGWKGTTLTAGDGGFWLEG